MSKTPLHKVQGAILYALRRAPALRFSELSRSTSFTDDIFKFHLRQLVKSRCVAKLSDGLYTLTPAGKELANNLDQDLLDIQKQPKLSVLLVVAKPHSGSGGQEYLFQHRWRHPYYGFWSCIGGPLQWDEDAEETAQRELLKQTGLTASFAVRAFYRKRDYTAAGVLLEDKLFTILEAQDVRGALVNRWHGGQNRWMSVTAFQQQERRFDSAYEAIAMIRSGQTFASRQVVYSLDDY